MMLRKTCRPRAALESGASDTTIASDEQSMPEAA